MTLVGPQAAEWGRIAWLVTRRALSRLGQRDAMLYVGGVSFFALLAFFPAVALIVSVYGLLLTPEQVDAQADALAAILPPEARQLFSDELDRFVAADHRAVSAQSVLALLVGVYAALRGVKALIAGLSFIHEEARPRGFVQFNVAALGVGVGAFLLIAAVSTGFVAIKLLMGSLRLPPVLGAWTGNEFLWAGLGLTAGLTLLYRYAMASRPVDLSPCAVGGAVAAALVALSSAVFAFYVGQVAHMGATYGAVGAVVIFLVWLSWNVNALFFGGALATEIERVRRPILHSPG